MQFDKPIALAADHGGYELKEALKAHLDELGIAYEDFGTDSTASVDYPDFAEAGCKAVQEGRCALAILCCGTGVGMSMCANKMQGIRACCCSGYLQCRVYPPAQRRQRAVHGRPRGGGRSGLPDCRCLPERHL